MRESIRKARSARMDGLHAVAEWMTWLRARGLAESSIRLYRTGVTRFLTEQVGGHPSEASESDVTTFLAGLGKKGQSRTKYLLGLRSFYGWCAKRGVAEDPTTDLRSRKVKPRPQVALTEEELTRLIYAAACRSQQQAWALLLSFGLGTRRTELVHITPADIHSGRVHLRVCKGGKQRWVELGPLAREAVAELRPWWNGTILGGVSAGTVTRWALKAATDAGLREKVRGRTHHVLRSSFATHLLRNGTPIHVVRDLMGHKDVSTTGLYAVSWEDDRRAAVAGL